MDISQSISVLFVVHRSELVCKGVQSQQESKKKNDFSIYRVLRESRLDQEEGDELDSHEEASPEEIKSREVVRGYRERAGLLLLQLFPNGGATDIVFVTLFCIAVGTAILRGAVPASLP